MSMRKLLDIGNKLLVRSRLGEVAWQASDAENTYFVTYSLYAFEIWSDEVFPDFYTISALNENGVAVESLEVRENNDNGEAYTLVSELYYLAKRRAIGADTVLDTLLQEIEQQST